MDSSRPALELADQNAALNNHLLTEKRSNGSRPTRLTCLRTTRGQTNVYDSIVLDPPAFAKSKRDLDAAIRGYKELNLVP